MRKEAFAVFDMAGEQNIAQPADGGATETVAGGGNAAAADALLSSGEPRNEVTPEHVALHLSIDGNGEGAGAASAHGGGGGESPKLDRGEVE